MKIIIVHSKKYGNRESIVDDSDYELVLKHHWHLTKTKSGCTYASTHIYKNGLRVGLTMHRLVMGLTDPKILCDHKDRNGLNNQRDNLRTATYGQNSQNKPVCRRNISGFKGVCLNRENAHRKYTAVIIADGKRIFGGGFKTPEEAARKWNEMARQYHSEFAYQNPV